MPKQQVRKCLRAIFPGKKESENGTSRLSMKRRPSVLPTQAPKLPQLLLNHDCNDCSMCETIWHICRVAFCSVCIFLSPRESKRFHQGVPATPPPPPDQLGVQQVRWPRTLLLKVVVFLLLFLLPLFLNTRTTKVSVVVFCVFVFPRVLLFLQIYEDNTV